jgi:hypothetical protein
MLDRRSLLRRAGVLALLVRGGPTARAESAAAAVLVRQPGGEIVAVTASGVEPFREPLPATPESMPQVTATPPESLVATVAGGAIGYWMTSPDGAAVIFRVDSGVSSTWWWRRGDARAMSLELPGDLQPAFPSGASARWFHGAMLDAAHLGSGTLRLLALDLATGELVLDAVLDRRLELAATAVSDDGAAVAHVQGTTAGAAFWAADLRGRTRVFDAKVVGEPGTAAASSIDLAVSTDGDAMLVAAGLAWDWPGAPGPAVSIMRAASPDALELSSLPGELIGIVSPT